MTSPKGWDTAEAARLHEYGWLHDGSCRRDDDGVMVCVCDPLPVASGGKMDEYGERDSADPSEPNIIRVAPAVPAISGKAGALRTTTGDRR